MTEEYEKKKYMTEKNIGGDEAVILYAAPTGENSKDKRFMK